MNRASWYLGLLALLAWSPAAAQPGHEGHDHGPHGHVHSHVPVTIDSGSFKIYRQGVELGTEAFTYVLRGDSLVVHSDVMLRLEREGRTDTLYKNMMLVLADSDQDLRTYESRQSFLGDELLRGLVMLDTAFTSYSQVNKIGTGSTLVRPPGRVFVMDPQVFALYDVVCRSLYEKTFTSRPLLFYSLGIYDSVIHAQAQDLGRETLRRDDITLQTRKLKITFDEIEFFVWMAEGGKMLMLEQPRYGLRVEREPQTLPPRASPPSKGG